MSDDKSAIQVADELFQEAYKEVEAKNYSAALQLCQTALAIYQKIGDLSGVAYTLATITDLCRLSLESLLPELEKSNLPISGDSNFLLLEPNIESPPSPEKFTKSLRIRIERGKVEPGLTALASRLIIEIEGRGELEPPPPPPPRRSRIDETQAEVRGWGELEPPPPPPPRRSRLVIELTELEPPSPSP